MKRYKLVKHLELEGCVLLREGARHSVYVNPRNQLQATVGRHRELDDLLCRKICKQLDIRMPK